jgi:DNA-binding PadR family transcriptional regulator
MGASSMIHHGQRSLGDLLEAERRMRSTSDEVAKELRGVLAEAAARLDGERYEAARHLDPNAPGNWSVNQWREFFKAIPDPRGWGIVQNASVPSKKNGSEEKRISELTSEIQQLLHELEQVKSELVEERAQKDIILQNAQSSISNAAKIKQPEVTPKGIVSDPMDKQISDAVIALSAYPANATAILKVAIDAGGCVGNEVLVFRKRVWTAIRAMGKGVSNGMELSLIVAEPSGAKSKTGSIVNTLQKMRDGGLIEILFEQMSVPQSTLKVSRFTQKGKSLFAQLFPSETVLNPEFDRVKEFAGGSTEKTVQIMYLLSQARKRGYFTCLAPIIDGSDFQPDVWVGRGDESHYMIFVESADENRFADIAALNQGTAYFCTTTKALMDHHAMNCSAKGIRGCATNLESIVTQEKYTDLGPDDPIWKTKW